MRVIELVELRDKAEDAITRLSVPASGGWQ
jgi:hypothetical protein